MRNVLSGEKHFTASVFLVTKERPKKVLLLFHKKQQSWLQPGGHIEQFENPVEAAIREVKEETGIDIFSLQQRIEQFDKETLSLPVPQFFLQETIPEYRDQPAHFQEDRLDVIS